MALQLTPAGYYIGILTKSAMSFDVNCTKQVSLLRRTSQSPSTKCAF